MVYSGSRLLWNTLGRRIVTTRTFGLVNLLHPNRHHVVPEFVPWSGDPQPIVAASLDLLRDEAKLAEMRREIAAVVDPLRGGNAGAKAAELARQLL